MDTEAVETVAITFGQPGCDDLRFAHEVAQTVGVPHYALPLEPDYLLHKAAQGVRLTDGMKSCVHMNVLGPLDAAAQHARVLYKGYLGGTIHGHVVAADRLAPMREEDWFSLIFAQRNHLFPAREWSQLYTEPMLRQVQDRPRQALHEALTQSHATWWVDKDSYVDLYQEDLRFTLLGVVLARSRALVRVPLADWDMLRFAASVVPGYRLGKSYYKLAMTRAFPALAKIPTTATGYPLANCFRQLRMRADEQLRWWLRSRGLSQIPVRQARPYANYAGWLRNQLRPWVEQTLLAPLALARGYFNPAYVRDLVAAHMAGQDHAHRLGSLLALELWHRQYID
jgi:asparagine synthase (glutamine-hydrolysing)